MLDGEHYVSSTYDKVFPIESSQDDVFSYVVPALSQTLKGFNCTIFAYGQTGSGKTHTMFGGNWSENNPAPQVYYKNKPSKTPQKNFQGPGIIPNSISKLFSDSRNKGFTFYCSLMQIYNEHLYDLLQDPKRDKALRIRENKLYGIYVEGLAEFIVENSEDCYLLLSKGDKNRAVRQTKFNHHSSRSHTIFQLLVESDKANKHGVMKKAKINFCDLAGSEKYDKENVMASEHIKELTQINKSLSMLGKVIHVLGTGTKVHIPYRDSKLTRLLQDSLGVSTRTILIATVSPASIYIEETISTLKFADRARQVMVKVKKNEISATNNQLITKLQREIQHLKTLLNLKRNGGIQELEQKIWVLTEENQKLKNFKSAPSVEEVENLKEENKRLRIELQKAGMHLDAGEYMEDDSIAPKSVLENTSPVHGNSEYEDTPIKPKSGNSNRITELSKVCQVCRVYFPCIHSSISSEAGSKAYSSVPSSKQYTTNRSTNSTLGYTERLTSRSPENLIKLNVRYKVNGVLIENDAAVAEMKEQETKKKEMQSIRARLNKIAEIENYRKEQFKREMQNLEENKKKEEDETKKKSLEQAKKRKILDEKKRMVDEFKRTKKITDELEQMKASELAKEAEEKRKLKNELKKKKLLEYYNKKKEVID